MKGNTGLILFAVGALVCRPATKSALACGETPYLLTPLLPLPDATGVPIDVALIGSSNLTVPSFVLRRPPIDADAGSPGVVPELTTECHPAEYDGTLCIARPTAVLQPETTYEWVLESGDLHGLPPNEQEPAWQTFTTSSARHEPESTSIDIAVTRNETFANPPCGNSHSATLTFDAILESPIVLNLTGFTPSYVMDALTLTPNRPNAEMIVYNPPECVVPEIFDVTGNRTALPKVCLEDELPATPFDDAGRSNRHDDGTHTGCRAGPSPHVPGRLGVLALVLLVLRRRERRHDVRSQGIEESSLVRCSAKARTLGDS